MSPINSQQNRIHKVRSPLGVDVLVLLDFSGTEYVNDINQFRLRTLATTPIDPSELLGKAMQVDIDTGAIKRHFHQIAYSARYCGVEQGGHVYEFEMRPWMWMMNRRVRSRIFHNTSVMAIFNQLFREYGSLPGAGFKDNTGKTYPELEYTVQYNESDLAFMRRLLEKYGINFHFRMNDNSHDLILTTDSDGFGAAENPGVIYNPDNEAITTAEQIFLTWSNERQIAPGALRMQDYNFTTPALNMEISVENMHPQEVRHEVYEYPGGYPNMDEGKLIAARRMAALRSYGALVRCQGDASGLSGGTCIDVSGHSLNSENGSYAVLSASHNFMPNSYRSGSSNSTKDYSGEYLITRCEHPIAPERITQCPRIYGPQTAVVTRGAEDVVDEHGRIWVQFHWDASTHSMPCRVSQLWAGNSWGTVFIPRVGMEVIVEFLHGDPDLPIITGCVYNAKNQAPWPLPGKKAVSGIKTTSMGGGGFNELSFDDTSGSEKITIHAQKNYSATVLNNASVDVQVNSSKTIGGNQTTTISGSNTVTVKKTSKLSSSTADVKIEAATKIELICGTSKITMTPEKVTITSTNVEISATAQLKTSGLIAQHGASIDLSIQSAIVRINS